MKHRRTADWRSQLIDQRGALTVEWMGFGIVMVVLVLGIYSALQGNTGLRQALTDRVSGYAYNFGQDIVARGPAIPQQAFRSYSDDFRVTINSQTGEYLAIDPVTGEHWYVNPALGVQVSIDNSQGLISLGDPTQGLTALLNPQRNEAVLIDHNTGSRRTVSIEYLQELSLVDYRKE